MNSNINIHVMDQSQLSGISNMPGSFGTPNAVMQSGASPLMQTSPQPASLSGQIITQQQQQQQMQAHVQHNTNMPQAEKIDNISKIKSLMGPMKESLTLAFRGAAFTLQMNNSIDNLKRDVGATVLPFDKHLEVFFAYCDLVELHLKTAMQCMQQLSLAQHYLPGVVCIYPENCMQDNPNGPISYTTYLNTVRVHIQLAKDIRDTLISASQNISQAD